MEDLKKLAKKYCDKQRKLDINWASEHYFIKGFETAQKELYTKEDIYNCLGAFAYKYGIVINGNDLDKWLKDRKL